MVRVLPNPALSDTAASLPRRQICIPRAAEYVQ